MKSSGLKTSFNKNAPNIHPSVKNIPVFQKEKSVTTEPAKPIAVNKKTILDGIKLSSLKPSNTAEITIAPIIPVKTSANPCLKLFIYYPLILASIASLRDFKLSTVPLKASTLSMSA